MTWALLTHIRLNRLVIQSESDGATIDKGFVISTSVDDSELLLCHGTACVFKGVRDLIRQLSRSSIYSTKPLFITDKSIDNVHPVSLKARYLLPISDVESPGPLLDQLDYPNIF